METEPSSPVSQGVESPASQGAGNQVVTRGSFLKATGGLVGFAALFGGVAAPTFAAGRDSTQNIINAALTWILGPVIRLSVSGRGSCS